MKKMIQKPYASTLMGCVKGACDFYGFDYSPAMLYGLTGHAFLINIHGEICPSGPYAWNHNRFYDLLTYLGLDVTESTLYGGETGPDVIRETGAGLMTRLDRDEVTMMTGLEHQLLGGYDRESFHIITPWEGDVPSQISRLNRTDWSECLGEAGFVLFTYFDRGEPEENREAAVHRALEYALELYNEPEKYQEEGYRMGPGAYENWIGALQKNKGDDHSNWWNATVWSESRRMGADFFEELKQDGTGGLDPVKLDGLIGVFQVISDRLSEAADKEKARETKIILLTEALEMEYEVQSLIGDLLS